uniref:Uncharacterized protein n=1 Tax=Vannella robusta TaxID=1487602 RepID=A0A7S4MP24_9EUKA
MRASTAFVFCFVVCVLVHSSFASTRRHYIAADEVEWNYAPSGFNNVEEVLLEEGRDSHVFFETGPDRIGGTYIKALYREYTDESFSELVPRDEHLGLLGPIIWAEVGDTIEIVFRNNARYPFSMLPHALFYVEETGQLQADPGETVNYTWYVPGRTSPTPSDWSSTLYPYHSHVDEVADTSAGLVGGVIVTRKGEAHENGHPRGIDREFIIMYSVIEESQSVYIDDNIATFLGEDRVDDEDLRDEDFDNSNGMNSINGLMYANIEGLEMETKERVRWYTFVSGSERDIHTAHWHGQTLVTMEGNRIDIHPIFPHIPQIMDMVPDSSGTWFFHCHVNAHLRDGMSAFFTVIPSADQYANTRNFATLYDPFAYLIHRTYDYETFLPELPPPSSGPFDPFPSSSGQKVSFSVLTGVLMIFLLS